MCLTVKPCEFERSGLCASMSGFCSDSHIYIAIVPVVVCMYSNLLTFAQMNVLATITVFYKDILCIAPCIATVYM